MKIHILQHVAYEGPANILPWAQLKNHDVTITKFFEPGWVLPKAADVELLFILGGPMGVYDELDHPWLMDEKRFLRDCIDIGRPVIGICLGAQLAADALGARVYTAPQKEIGWFPIRKTNIPHPVLFDFSNGQMVFQWHNDTFDLPDGALLLASSEACANQAFIWREQVMGFQFHMEMSMEHIETLLANCFQDLKEGSPYVQSDTVIRTGTEHAELLAPLFDCILTRFTS